MGMRRMRSVGTPLHNAAMKGRKEIAELLITNSANVNAQLDDGWTPLNSAIQLKQTKIAASSANTAARRVKN